MSDAERDPGRPSDTWIGRVVDGRYQVTERLGEGGMGAVYVAQHLKLQKPVALKIIHPELAGDDELAARFAREAMASARLDHPHVASALDYGTLPEGGAYLVTQLVRGTSLQAVIDHHGRIPWPRACELGAQVADALSAAHAIGIVHRDLKPDNVLLERRDDGSDLVKVLDFGIARVIGEEGAKEMPSRQLTQVGTVMGTPGYMAPEQAMGEEVDHRADLYSLGVVLWEMIAGRPLFDAETLTAIVTVQLTQQPPPLTQVARDPSLPAELVRLVAALLGRTPGDRPDAAGGVRDALRAMAFRASMGGDHRVSLTSVPVASRPDGTAPTQIVSTGADHPVAHRETVRATVAGVQTPMQRTLTQMRQPRVAVPVLAFGCGLPVVAAIVLGVTFAMFRDDEPEAVARRQAPDQPIMGGLLEKAQEVAEAAVDPTPPPVRERINTLAGSSDARARREAADWLHAHEPESQVPPYAKALADLERERGCRGRAAAIEKIEEIGDERALKTLRRWADLPKSGCGFLRRRDCYGCIRDELDDAIQTLSGETSGDGP